MVFMWRRYRPMTNRCHVTRSFLDLAHRAVAPVHPLADRPGTGMPLVAEPRTQHLLFGPYVRSIRFLPMSYARALRPLTDRDVEPHGLLSGVLRVLLE